MFEQKGFKLGRSNLIAFDFDEFFLAVDDEEAAFVVDVGDVARFEPAVFCQGFGGCFGILPVPANRMSVYGSKISVEKRRD